MLLVLLNWLLAFGSWFLAGYVFWRWISAKEESPRYFSPELLGFMGLAQWAVVAQLVSLLGVGLSPWWVGGIDALLLGYVVLQPQPFFNYLKRFPKYRTVPPHGYIVAFCIGLLALLALAKAAVPTSVFDEGSYYIQTIRWAEQYGYLKGLANLHGRLGFNSSFHLICALFHIEWLTGIASFDLSELVVVMTLSLIGRPLLQNVTFWRASHWAGLLIVIAIGLYTFEALSSPKADTIVLCTLWVMVWLIIRRYEQRQLPALDDSQAKVLLLLALFCLTVKLSALPVLLIPAWQGLAALKQGHKRYLQFAVTAAVLFIVPWIIRFYLLTGYLLYPVKATGFLAPQWQVPAVIAEQEAAEVTAFAQVDFFIPFFQANPEVEILNFTEFATKLTPDIWLPWWFKLEMSRHAEWPLLLVTGLALLLWLAWRVYALATKRKAHVPAILWMQWAMVLGLVFWAWKAPAFRFGVGYMVAFLVLTLAPLFTSVNWGKATNTLWVPIVLLAFTLLGAKMGVDTRAFKQHVLAPADALKPTYDTEMIDGVAINKPNQAVDDFSAESKVEMLCYDCDLPCWHSKVPGLRMLEPGNLKAGFYITTGLPDSLYYHPMPR